MSTVLQTAPQIRGRHLSEFPGYAVLDDGTLWRRNPESGRRAWDWVQPSPCGDGGFAVNLQANGLGKRLRVAVLVLAAFVGPRPAGCYARHINGDKADNRLANLCWEPQLATSEPQ